VGIVLALPQGHKLCYTICLHFDATNNVAECEALINELRIATKVGVRRFLVRGGTMLVIDQVGPTRHGPPGPASKLCHAGWAHVPR
jgi:ribonuclease HI